MIGCISTEQKCSICGKSLIDNGKNVACPKHRKQAATRFRVRLSYKGERIQAKFSNYDEASRFLTGLRYKIDEGTLDARDYRADNPLGFANLVEKWLSIKKTQIKPKTWNNLNNYMKRAVRAWENRNIKEISYADIEDFLFHHKSPYGMADLSSKTRSNARSALHDFWHWLVKRRQLHVSQLPDFPEVPFELTFRKTVGIETQTKIIEEVRRISYDINPRIWLGIRWLATYFAIRPGEMIKLKEGQIDLENGIFILQPEDTKEKKPKLVPMLEEDIELVKTLPRSFLELPFFRHLQGVGGRFAGNPFGDKYLYKWWRKACTNLGIEGVDLYAGTRHSTVIALGEFFTPEELKQASMHSTNKAFERYFRVKPEMVKSVYQVGRDTQNTQSKKTHTSVSSIRSIRKTR